MLQRNKAFFMDLKWHQVPGCHMKRTWIIWMTPGSTRKLARVITGGVDKILDRRNRSCLASDLHNYLLADWIYGFFYSSWKGYKQLQCKYNLDKFILKASGLNKLTVATGHIPNHVRADFMQHLPLSICQKSRSPQLLERQIQNSHYDQQ